jgi:hypothetical protein
MNAEQSCHVKCGEKLMFHAGNELPDDELFDAARNVVDEAQRKANDVAQLAVVSPLLDAALDKLRACHGSPHAVHQLLSFIHKTLCEQIDATQCRELELLLDAVRALRNFNKHRDNNDDNDGNDDEQRVEFAVQRLWTPLCMALIDGMPGYSSNVTTKQATAKLDVCNRMLMAFEAKSLQCSDADKHRDMFSLASMARKDLTIGTFVRSFISFAFFSFRLTIQTQQR